MEQNFMYLSLAVSMLLFDVGDPESGLGAPDGKSIEESICLNHRDLRTDPNRANEEEIQNAKEFIKYVEINDNFKSISYERTVYSSKDLPTRYHIFNIDVISGYNIVIARDEVGKALDYWFVASSFSVRAASDSVLGPC